MKLKTLSSDKTLIPASIKSGEERSMRGAFIRIRVAQIRSAAPDPEDIPDADVPALKTQLATNLRRDSLFTLLRWLYSLFGPNPIPHLRLTTYNNEIRLCF